MAAAPEDAPTRRALLNGKGLKKDKKQAIEFFKRACEAGSGHGLR